MLFASLKGNLMHTSHTALYSSLVTFAVCKVNLVYFSVLVSTSHYNEMFSGTYKPCFG